MLLISGFIHVREMLGKFFFSRSGNSVMCQGKMKFCKKCQGNVMEFYISARLSRNVWSRFIFLAKFIKFPALILSWKFEFTTGKSQENVREFWTILNV